MPAAPNGAIPVEAILKLAIDKSGADNVKKFMEDHEKSWSRIEHSIGKIGDGIEHMTRFGMGLAGVAGIGAVVNNFLQTSQAGSNVALAAGRVTGGPGTWHPYGQSMLAAQAQTGVSATAISQGLIMALQSVGGTPTPQQAAVVGGLLAGYGQTTGLSPGQVEQVLGPLLQASNKALTPGSILGVGATLSGGLTAFPGSQAGPMLGLLSQLGVQQAIGGGPGFTPDLHGLTAAVNAAAQANSIFRNPSIAGGAIGSVSGGLQNAYGNPSQEAFMQMAGISYADQRKGFTPQNVQRIMASATRIYGTGTTRDIFLRSMFGLQGADLLEEFAPGSRGSRLLQQNLQHHGSTQGLLNQIHHAQQRTTPQATGNRFGGDLLHWLEASPLHAALGLAGLLGGPKLLKGGFNLLGKGVRGGLSKLFGTGAEDALGAVGADAGGSTLAELLGAAALGVPMGVLGGLASSLISPDDISSSHLSSNQTQRLAVQNVLKMAKAKFGGQWRSPAARNWMQQQLYSGGVGVYGAAVEAGGGFHRGKFAPGAGQLLDSLLGDQYAPHQADPLTRLNQAADQLLKAAMALQHGGRTGASYTGGSSSVYASLGTPAIQALGAGAPGLEFASLSLGSAAGGSVLASFGGGGGGGTFVSNTGGGGGGGGSGWQPCTLTWYDPALGGTNSASGRRDPHSRTGSGQPYQAGAMTCAAPPNYAYGTQIQFSYNGQTVTCTVNDRGGAIQGHHFDLSRGAAQALGMISAGVVSARFRVVGSGSTGGGGSRGGGGASSGGGRHGVFAAADTSSQLHPAYVPLAAPGGGGQKVEVHFNVDGRRVQTQRVLLGHKA